MKKAVRFSGEGRNQGEFKMIRFVAVLAATMFLGAMPALAADASLSPQANAAYLAAYANKPGVVKRPSGLMYRILQNGFGATPKATDNVMVYYKGSLINGTVFDSTEPGLPATFQTNRLIPGWTEALQLMREGDHWEIVLPPSTAYGTRGAGNVIPPNQTLVFDLQLVKVLPPAPNQGPQGQDDQGGGGSPQ